MASLELKKGELSSLSRRRFLALAAAGATSILTMSLPCKAFAESMQMSLFVDSLGRSVSVPRHIPKIIPLGVPAQTLLTTLCPHELTSLALSIEEDAKDYEEAGLGSFVKLPNSESVYADKLGSYVSTESLSSAANVIIIDAGLPYDGVVQKLDLLQKDASMPCLFIDLSFGRLAEAYRALGSLLGCSERAEELALWVERAQALAADAAADRDGDLAVLYAPRENGTMLRGGVGVQLDALRFAGSLPFEGAYDYSAKKVSAERAATEPLDLVLFDDTEIPSQLYAQKGAAYELWSQV